MILGLTFSAVLVCAAPQAAEPRPTADLQRAQAHYAQGWQALKAESYEDAAREFQAAVDINPRFALAYYGLGRADMALKRFAAAVHAYERSKAEYESAAGQTFKGQLDANRARQDQELELREAIRQSSQGPQTQRSQEMVRQFQNQLRLVQQSSDRGMNVSIDASVPAFLSLALGSAYFRSERFGDAERAYTAAVTSDPKLGEAWNNLGVVYATQQRYVEAERALKMAEKAGYHVNPQLKDEVRQGKGRAS